MGRREKMWCMFWEEVITCQLKDEYDEKKATLEKLYSRKKKHENNQPRKDDRPQQNSKDKLKRKSSSGKTSDSCKKYYKVNDDGTRRSLQEDGDEREFRPKHHHNKDENLDKPLKIPDGAGGEFTLQETVSLLNDIAPYIGAMGTACEMLCHKMKSSWYDKSKLCKLFEDEHCRSVMKNVVDKARELSGNAGTGMYSRKLKLASLQGSCLLYHTRLARNGARNHGTVSPPPVGYLPSGLTHTLSPVGPPSCAPSRQALPQSASNPAVLQEAQPPTSVATPTTAPTPSEAPLARPLLCSSSQSPVSSPRLLQQEADATALSITAPPRKEGKPDELPYKDDTCVRRIISDQRSEVHSSTASAALGINEIAKITYNMEPAHIIQVIKYALTARGIVNPSEVKVTEVYKAISSAHVGMALESEKNSLLGCKEQAPMEKVAKWNLDDSGDVHSSQAWLTGELDDLIKNLGKSKPSGSSLRDDEPLQKSVSNYSEKEYSVGTSQGPHASEHRTASREFSEKGLPELLERVGKSEKNEGPHASEHRTANRDFSEKILSDLLGRVGESEKKNSPSVREEHSSEKGLTGLFQRSSLENALANRSEKNSSSTRGEDLSEENIMEYISTFF